MALKLCSVALLVVMVVISLSGEVNCDARPKHHELSGYTFERYVVDFGKGHVSGTQEYEERKKLFEVELAAVRAHNEAKGAETTYKKGVNRFSDWTETEKHQLRGVVFSERGAGELQSTGTSYKKLGIPLPPSIDFRSVAPSVLTAVKDQGKCGSCWAHAATESIETHAAIRTGELFVLSQQQITSCARNPNHCGGSGGCAGATAELAFDYVTRTHTGVVQEWQYPYESYGGTTGSCHWYIPFTSSSVHLDGYISVPSNDANAVQEALVSAGPLAIMVDADLWLSYEAGIFDGCSYAKNISMNHLVQLVGYGVDRASQTPYWLVRNSWSPAWGEAGYIRLKRFPGHEPCGWNVNPQNGNGCHGETAPQRACGMCGMAFDALYPKIR